VYDVSVMY